MGVECVFDVGQLVQQVEAHKACRPQFLLAKACGQGCIPLPFRLFMSNSLWLGEALYDELFLGDVERALS